ncbi:MAG: acetoacetate--CoA ligase [Micavibrio sp.]
MSDTALWSPSDPDSSDLAQFMRMLMYAGASYDDFWRWSVDNPQEFWDNLWDFCEIIGEKGGITLENPEDMQKSRFFPQGKLNYAENMLKYRDDRPAIIFRDEKGRERSLSFAGLAAEVARWQKQFEIWGVQKGDRIAACMPNMPETVIAVLASASIGAIWSSASPDFGVQGLIDRFGQIAPKVFITVDGYFYGGKTIDCLDKARQVCPHLEGLERVVVVPFTHEAPDISALANGCLCTSFAGKEEAAHDGGADGCGEENAAYANKEKSGAAGDAQKGPAGRYGPSAASANAAAATATATAATSAAVAAAVADPVPELRFERVEFNHPLFIMFSSGTTGVPKCIVHGHGGTLLQHVKEHCLQSDVKFGDRIFYFTTCGWMMWNWLISGLATGATLLLYDGSPFHPDGNVLWDFAEKHKATLFGTSAKYIDALKSNGLNPGRDYNLSSLRTLCSTGSPLVHESFDYVYAAIKSDLHLASISGGTDIVSCFVLGNPVSPVWRGEIQGAGLGMAVDVFDEDGKPLPPGAGSGELVCTKPFPCMPVMFWNDPDGAKYSAAYFERFENVWCHGDWIERTSHGGFIIHGRSDATLNPGGVRIGTAEIYRQVEQIADVQESIAVGQEWQGDVRIILFVRLKEGVRLDENLEDRLRRQIRAGASPRHVPAKIIAIADIPRTKSGKITELAVRDVIHGRKIKNVEALANPEALDLYRRDEVQAVLRA